MHDGMKKERLRKRRGRKAFSVFLSVLLVLCVCVPHFAWADVAGVSALASNTSNTADNSSTGGGADSGKADNTADEGEDPEPEPDPDPEPAEKNYVTELFLKWSSDYDGPNKFVGEGEEIETVEIAKKGQLVQLNGYYLDNSGSGVLLETGSSSTDLGQIELTFESSDLDVCTVSPTGVVTPRGDGECVISAEVANPDKYGSARVEVLFVVSGQDGEYVGSVDVLDEDGNPILETIEIASDGKKPVYYQLNLQVTWVDADGNTVRTETSMEGNITATYTWETGGNTSVLSVNSKTGRVSTQEQGIGTVVVNVAGGVGGRTVSDTVHFRVNTGQTGYNPADHLTINISYEMYPDQIVASKTFSADELASLLPQSTYNFTVISGSTYGTIRATGYLFKDVLNLLSSDLDDISMFRFGTADNYDSPISYDYLYGSARYYFPDYDIGYTSGAVVVPPILATASTIFWNQSYISPNEELDIGTRYRLVFGVSDTGDANTSHQVYYIDTLNVILKGAPPEGSGDDDGSGGSDDSSSGNTNGSGKGSDSGSNSGTEGASTSNTAGGYFKDSVTAAVDGGSSEEASETSDTGSSTWRIYQMMKQQKSDPGDLDLDNPLAPFAVPGACAAFALGGVTMGVGFRRRLM